MKLLYIYIIFVFTDNTSQGIKPLKYSCDYTGFLTQSVSVYAAIKSIKSYYREQRVYLWKYTFHDANNPQVHLKILNMIFDVLRFVFFLVMANFTYFVNLIFWLSCS